MQQYQNLFLIGTSHISKQSIDEITDFLSKVSPEIVAVELDKNRAEGLMSEKQGKASFRDIRRVGVKGFLFALIGSWASKKLGKVVGVSPGSEMKTAIKLAKEKNIRVALIDQHIEITLKRFSQTLSWKEKWHIVADIFSSPFNKKNNPMLKMDLSKVPEKELINTMVSSLKGRYPNIYKVLIEERNYYMARQLKKLMHNYPDKPILAVVGAGHEEGILKILNENEGI